MLVQKAAVVFPTTLVEASGKAAADTEEHPGHDTDRGKPPQILLDFTGDERVEKKTARLNLLSTEWGDKSTAVTRQRKLWCSRVDRTGVREETGNDEGGDTFSNDEGGAATRYDDLKHRSPKKGVRESQKGSVALVWSGVVITSCQGRGALAVQMRLNRLHQTVLLCPYARGMKTADNVELPQDCIYSMPDYVAEDRFENGGDPLPIDVEQNFLRLFISTQNNLFCAVVVLGS
ncbi:hypothetical protein FIBSPDRAFT_885593 [Athelia psychrophila]|uniref:Uncharacterized protein n=1 Tax=Athelia psychrophila TaxID=1759441 RepID=A0A166RWV6_9AGAM|nr:hypothetical protein FIBSPDRAFT_885593 [Fibularhizoctonia sp. CBS 109695]